MTIANRDLFQALKAQAALTKAFGPPLTGEPEPHALAPGEQIEAWHNGRLYHRGTVIKTVAGTGLFWILDADTGGKRLLDMELLEILPAEPGGEQEPAPAVQAPEPAPTATVTPISLYPIFQDGSQAIA